MRSGESAPDRACPSPLSVIARGPDDSHVRECLTCCALYESIQASAETARTVALELDCGGVQSLMDDISSVEVPPIEWLSQLFTHAANCASCRRVLKLAPSQMGTEPTVALKAPEKLTRGDMLGRFEITGRLGEGGMGVVVSAYDPNLDRGVAIKVVHETAFRGVRAAQAEKRLVREAQAMAKIRHPNVITVYEVGKVDDQVYIVMEQVNGATLGDWLKAAQRTWQDILHAFRAAGDGLAAAHAAGLIHRDFKPENVLVGNEGGIYVTDFGLVAAPGEHTPVPSSMRAIAAPPVMLDSQLTRTGELLGTPKYMAPEQHHGLPTDARTDQFSFCIALYEALYKALPFRGDTYAMLMANVTNGVLAEPPKTTLVPDWIRPVLLRGLSTDPASRYESMKDLLTHLEIPSKKRLGLVAAMGGAAVLVASAATIAMLRTPRSEPSSLCEGAGQKLAGVWDVAAKDDVRKAFSAVGPAYAVDTVQRLDTLVSRYTTDWVGAQTDACKAARVYKSESEEMLDLRVSCLDRRRYALQSLIALWRNADREIIANAIAAVRQLPPISDCSAGALALSPTAKLANPAKQKELDALEKQVTAVEALLHAGKYREGIKIAEIAQPAAETLSYAPLTAELLLTLGQLQWRAGHMKDSVATLELAYDAAETAGSARYKALAANELTYVHASERQDFEEAQRWASRARASLKNLGGDAELEAQLLRSVGIAQNKSGRFAEALESFRESLAIREKLYGPTQSEVAFSLASMAVPMIALGDGQGAITHLTRAIGIAEQEFGKEHPELGDLYNNLGVANASIGDLKAAHTHYTRSLTVQENALGPRTVKLADVLTNLGGLAVENGDLEVAAKYIERAARLEEDAYGPENSALGVTLTHLANVRANQDMPQEALTLARRAISIHRKENHPNMPVALAVAAGSAFALAKKTVATDRARAIELAREALAAAEESGEDASELLAEIQRWAAAHK